MGYLLYHNAPKLLIADILVTELTTVIYAANWSKLTPAWFATAALYCIAVEISATLVAYALSNDHSVTFYNHIKTYGDQVFLLDSAIYYIRIIVAVQTVYSS